MYKAKIIDIKKERHQSSNSDFLKVKFDIINDEGDILISKNIALNVDTKKEEVIADVNSHVKEYAREIANRGVEEKKEKENKEIEEIKNELIGKTI